MLCDKVSGNLMGLFLLIPDHLRLKTWDLVCQWTGEPADSLSPRLAMQMIHESSLCITSLRERSCIRHKGFEVLNGLGVVASDTQIHKLLDSHTVEDSRQLQINLGKLRMASGDYVGKRLAIDPHRIKSHSKRRMRRRSGAGHDKTSTNTLQTFFCLDIDTKQPVAFTIASSALSVPQVTPGLLGMVEDILAPCEHNALILADTEHESAELFTHVHNKTPFELLCPVAARKHRRERYQQIPHENFQRHRSGYATTRQPYHFTGNNHDEFVEIVQRCGERQEDYQYKGFLSTCELEPNQALCIDYLDRWDIEEFFNINQALGWKRAGTQNLNIRYGKMSLALVGNSVMNQLRKRLGDPYQKMEAQHLAEQLFRGLDGDLRVKDDTLVVTYYNAPKQIQNRYENITKELEQEGVSSEIPWLYDLKLSFRFK